VSGAITVLLADDHTLVLRMLGDRLAGEPGIQVVGCVGCAADAVAEAERLRPDVVILDIDMPGVTSFEAARTIRAGLPDTRLIFLSTFFNDAYIDQALAVEATAYLTKSEPPETVIQAIRGVMAGQRHFSPEVEARIVVDRGGVRLAGRGRSRASTLSNRELEILRYVARGLSQKEIAGLTSRSSKTVHKHCNNIMAKLDIHDRVELTRFAIREGLAEA